MNAALVTGGAGFIGSHLVEALLREDVSVTVLDNFETGQRECVPPSVRLIEADILDADAVDEAVAGVEVIFHAAACVSVGESFRRPEHCFAVNTIGLCHVLRSAVRHQVRKVVFSSSSAVYADAQDGVQEEDPPRPASPYAISKRSSEHLLDMSANLHGLASVALRYFNVYGPRQSPDGEDAAVIPAFIKGALRGEPLTMYGDGTQTRDFVYVEDVVEANLCAAKQGAGIYNIGNGQAVSVYELGRQILELIDSSSQIIFSPPRSGDVRHSQANIVRAAHELNWKPRWMLRDGLAQTIAWFRAHQGTVNVV